MRRLLDRSSPRPRAVLHLETLEDRRVPSAGGLLSGLLYPTPAAASPHASPAAPTSLLAAPLALLAPVTTAVQDLGGAVLASHGNTAGAVAPISAGAIGLNLNLNVDLLFIHADNIHLNVSVVPAGSGQPLLSLGLGASVGVGPQTGGLLNLASEVGLGLGLGGSAGVALNVGLSSGGAAGALVSLGLGLGGANGAFVNLGLGLPGGQAPGAGQQPGVLGGFPGDVPPSGGGAGSSSGSSSGGGSVAEAPPPSGGPTRDPGAGSTPNVTPNPAEPAFVAAPATAAALPGAPPAQGRLADGPGTAIEPRPSSPAENASATLAPLSGAHSVATLPAEQVAPTVDGGGDGSTVDAALLLVVPLTNVQGADDGGGGDPVTPPDAPAGAGQEKVETNPAPEASDLATRFQPLGLEGIARDLVGLIGRCGPKTGWLAVWLARLRQLAPWLVGPLLAAAAVYEIRRQRRKAAKAAAPAPVE